MNTIQAFMMGRANQHRQLMVFDWDEAARRIRSSGAKAATAGLRTGSGPEDTSSRRELPTWTAIPT
jgi:hypothetical protein